MAHLLKERAMENIASKYEAVNLSEQEVQDYFTQNACSQETRYFFMTLLRMMFNSTERYGAFGEILCITTEQRNHEIRLLTGQRKQDIQSKIDEMLEKGMLIAGSDGAIRAPHFFKDISVQPDCFFHIQNGGGACHVQ